jgi:AcrR family transcriptional regulator
MGEHADTEALEGIGTAGSRKRQALLDGMLEAVGAVGYERTSVRTVLDRTGAYRQAFYDHFTDKADCYVQAFGAGVERIEARVLHAASDEDEWTGRLRAGLGALLGCLEAKPDVGRALVVEVHAAGPEALARRAAAMERASAFLDRAREEASDGPAAPALAGEGIAAGIHAVVHSRLAAAADDGFGSLLPEFMYFAVLPYFGAGRARAAMRAAQRGGPSQEGTRAAPAGRRRGRG